MIPEEKPPLSEEGKKSVEENNSTNSTNSTNSANTNKNATPPLEPKPRFIDYFNSSTRDILAYAMLVIGVLLLFFHPLVGEFLIGVVAGAYFSKEINDLIKNYQNVVEEQGLVRSLILGGILLAFLVAAPGIFIGIAFIMILKLFIFFDDKPVT
jgi:hypothetical protein